MGIFGRVPSGGGPGTSRKDRRQSGARARSKTVARRETERRAQVIVLAGIIVVAIAVLGIAGFGYYQTSMKPKQQAALKVGDRSFNMGYVGRRLRYEIRNAAPGQIVLQSAQLAVLQTLSTVESEELNRIGASQQNIGVSKDELDAKIRQKLGIAESADQTTYADAYRTAVRDSGLSPDQYREVTESQLLEEKIRQNIRSGIPATAEQVRLFDIQVQTQDEAQKVVDRLTAGEDFSAIAAELSLDTDTKDKGGEMGWMTRGALDTSVADAVFALEAGQWTQPIYLSNRGSYFVYKVMDKAASMEVTSDQQSLIEDQSYANQQDEILKQVQVERPYLTDKDIGTRLLTVANEEGVQTSTGQ